MKKIIIGFLLLSVYSLFADINWDSSLSSAMLKAEEEDKNIFVLITAPTWCSWCIKLENNVLNKPEFQEYLQENYIPLKVLDQIDGVRNSELDKFGNFPGYPTVRVYNKKGQFIEDIYTQDPIEMVNNLKKYVDVTEKVILTGEDLPDEIIFVGKTFVKGESYYISDGEEIYPFKIDESNDEVFYLILDTQRILAISLIDEKNYIGYKNFTGTTNWNLIVDTVSKVYY